jgi:hypothetical protein
MLTQNLKTVEDQRALLSQLSSMLPSAQNLNSAITTLANNDFLAAATKLLSSNPLLNQQFAFSALTQNIGMGQNPQDLWRSTPNLNLLAASAETPSAFRPLSSSSSSTKDSTSKCCWRHQAI